MARNREGTALDADNPSAVPSQIVRFVKIRVSQAWQRNHRGGWGER
jgi:hypothetical protein